MEGGGSQNEAHLTKTQIWLMAHRLGEEYWLYVVEKAANKPELYLIPNQASNLTPDEEVEIVRYVLRDWKDKGKKA